MPHRVCALIVGQITLGWSMGHRTGAVRWPHQLGAAALELLQHIWQLLAG